MYRKLPIIKLVLLSIFLFTTVFPPSLLSYERVGHKNAYDSQHDWVDESLEHKDVVYKKIRCPRCGMEFYYIPGKESPHAHFVHYEMSDERLKALDSDLEEQLKKRKILALEEDVSFRLLMQNMEEIEEKIANIEKRQKSFYFPESQKFREGRYEIRQKLTCPYDGYAFFPEGDVIEDRILMQGSLASQNPSIIEASFSKSIAFGTSKELNQFGYDLFMLAAKRKRDEEETEVKKKSAETFTAMGMLKNVLEPESMFSSFSTEPDLDAVAIVPVGPDYIVGPGDTLIINIWGIAQESFSLEVDGEGKIMLPKAGPLYVRGLRFREVESRIKGKLNQYYANLEIDVSMGKLRNIQVYVMGEVKEPGSYVLDPQSNIFQALYASGGPTKLGTLRKIKLIHADRKKEEVDLYPFLLEGGDVVSSRIQSGDTLFVPTIGDVVAITGNVKRPAIYETKSEISLNDLLNFAGGIMPTGDLQRLQVERISNNERRVMFDIELEDLDNKNLSLKDINVQNGDMVIVSPIVRLRHDFVSILGNVERPGDYALNKDTRVKDLIKMAKGFLPGTYFHRAEIARVTKDRTRRIIPVNLDNLRMASEEENILLNEWDILLIYSEAEIVPPSFVEIDGAINRPGKYELMRGMKVSDLIFKAGGVKLGEIIKEAELFHIIPGKAPVIRRIAIKRLSDVNISIDKDIILRAGDALFVKSEPKLSERKLVTIKGEVNYPGVYSMREGERLSSLIERAGGFTKEAFLEGTIFTRGSIKKVQEKMRQHFIERETRALLGEQQAILLREREGSGTEIDQIAQSIKMRTEILEYINSAKIEGRMIIQVTDVSKLKGSDYDILLEDGDTITIPQTPSSITVIGSVNNPASVPFEKEKSIEYYIRKTGGLTRHAHKSGIYMVRANGEATSKFMMSKKVNRGDTIIVPQEFKYWTPPGKILRDTVEILSRIIVGVGIIAALD